MTRSPSQHRIVLYLYGHGSCSLCDRLEAMARPTLADRGIDLVKRDITTDRAWMDLYRTRIPVLTTEDGRVLVEGRPQAAEVAAALTGLR